jgi:hypothetical protein
MKIEDFKKLHCLSDEDMSIIDALKKTFNGPITDVCSGKERAEIITAQQSENKVNIDRLWIK